MKKSSFVLRLLLEWILICVGVLGSLYCLTTTFEFPMPFAVQVAVPVLALFCCLLFNGKIGKYYAIAVFALLLIALWLLWEDVVEGLRNLWGTIGQIYYDTYNTIVNIPVPENTDPNEIGPGLLILAMLETYLSALGVRLWKRTAPMAIALLLGIAPCFIVLNMPLRLIPIMAAVLSVLTLTFSQSARRRETGEASKAMLLSALLSVALMGLLLLLFPKEGYTPPITSKKVTEIVDKWSREISNHGNINAGLEGNPSEIELNKLSDLPDQSVPSLFVTSSVQAYVYLRGSSYADFDGSNWTRGEAWSGGASALFPYLDQQSEGKITIETEKDQPTLFTPYQVTELPGGKVYADSYVENTESLERYTVYFTQNPIPVEPDPAYEAWVLDHYLAVPQQTRTGVLAWWDEADGEDGPGEGITLGDPEQTEQFARKVAKAVSMTAKYSRSPVRAPKEDDFCTWFLNEAEEGYCVHFATSCTVLLRSLGVPARYVTGYVCSLKANQRTQLTNFQAHAWVEIWCGGCWVVIEPTPDDATEFPGELDPEGENSAYVPETRPPLPTGDHQDLPPITKATKPVNDEPTVPESSEPTETKAPEAETNKGKLDLTPLWVFLGIIGFLALVLGRRALAMRLRKRRLWRAKGNAKARLLYRYIVRLHKLAGNPIPPEATELAQKAAFSQHELDEEEITSLRQIYNQQCNLLRCYSLGKRIWFKYILAVV